MFLDQKASLVLLTFYCYATFFFKERKYKLINSMVVVTFPLNLKNAN